MKKMHSVFRSSQQGFVLLLIILAMFAVGGVLFMSAVAKNASSFERQQANAQVSNDVLSAAKSALIGYAVQTTDGAAGYRLGNLITPDSNASNNALVAGLYTGKSDGNMCLQNPPNGFKGTIDSAGVPNPNQRCLGKFPWRDLGLNLGSVDVNDPLGRVPWLAISGNLNPWDQCIQTLNSDLLNWTYQGPVSSCPVAQGRLPYPWMTVYDENNIKLNDRVAAVLIMPGAPIVTGSRIQARTPTNPGSAADYLDAISLPLGCSGSCTATYDNADLSNRFIAVPPGTRYPVNAENLTKAGQPVSFNDQLIYITIDELMPFIERRVLSEMKSALLDFKSASKTGNYPWMAPFSAPADISKSNSIAGTTFGLFPFIPTAAFGGIQQSTDFDWSINKTYAKICKPAGSKYINLREFVPTMYAAGSTTATASTCTWKTGSPRVVTCDYSSSLLVTPKTFTSYSNSACTSVSGTLPLTVTTAPIKVSIDAACNSSPTIGYASASASDFSRWSWQCAKVTSTTTFSVAVTYYVTNGASFVGTDTLSIDGKDSAASVSRMRYQPVMPYWFYQNEWYKSAFAAIAPSKAPSAVAPCGAAPLLTSGSNPSVEAIVMLAGRQLSGQAIRPASTPADYLEAPNVSAGTNCVFAGTGSAVSNNFNDQTLVVAP